eukprot:UC4_evm5s1341
MSSPSQTSRLHRSGWLTKRGKMVKNWKRRWFMLDPETKVLSYYDSEQSRGKADTSSKPKGTIHLSEQVELLSRAECEARFDGQRPFVFGVQTAKREYFMQADTEADATEWFRMLNIVKVLKGGKTPATDGNVRAPGNAWKEDNNNNPKLSHQPKTGARLNMLADITSAVQSNVSDNISQAQARKEYELIGDIELPHVDLLTQFKHIREPAISKANRDTDQRLTRLKKLCNPPDGTFNLKLFEQKVVPWEKDADVFSCPYCMKAFSSLSLFQKSHCRLCGKVVCAECVEKDLPAGITAIVSRSDNRSIKTCINCLALLKRAEKRISSSLASSQLLKLYKEMRRIMAEVDKGLIECQDACRRESRTPVGSSETTRLKKKVADLLIELATFATKIEKLGKVKPEVPQKIYTNLCAAATQWAIPRSAALKMI